MANRADHWLGFHSALANRASCCSDNPWTSNVAGPLAGCSNFTVTIWGAGVSARATKINRFQAGVMVVLPCRLRLALAVGRASAKRKQVIVTAEEPFVGSRPRRLAPGPGRFPCPACRAAPHP